MDSSKENEIKELSRSLNDQEIAKVMNVTDRTIRNRRYKFKIHPKQKPGRPIIKNIDRKKIICSLLNKENAFYPLSDKSISKILLNLGWDISLWGVSRLRYAMNIPPSRSLVQTKLNRKYLYFTKGRYIWKPNGNHERRKKC